MNKSFCWYVSLKTIRQPKIVELLDLNFGKKNAFENWRDDVRSTFFAVNASKISIVFSHTMYRISCFETYDIIPVVFALWCIT